MLRLRRRARPTSVVLLSRSGCRLCELAEPVVARAAADAGVSFRVRDVDADPELRARWTDKVPVVLLDGVEHAYWRINDSALRRALRG